MKKYKIRIACIQMSAGENVASNLARASRLISIAKTRGADLACLPEVFHFRGRSEWLSSVCQTVSSPLVRDFRILARRKKIGILLGSIIEKGSRAGHYFNTSVLIGKSGRILAKYRKIHLFKIRLGKLKEDETRRMLPGKTVTTAVFDGVRVGLTVCYDLRFPELYRELARKGARIIFVPSNFTEHTGRAHWEVLLRSRAIENQIYLAAPAQVGKHPASGIRSHGHSLIVDPWGRILGQGTGRREEVVVADLDLGSQARLRAEFPVLDQLPVH